MKNIIALALSIAACTTLSAKEGWIPNEMSTGAELEAFKKENTFAPAEVVKTVTVGKREYECTRGFTPDEMTPAAVWKACKEYGVSKPELLATIKVGHKEVDYLVGYTPNEMTSYKTVNKLHELSTPL